MFHAALRALSDPTRGISGARTLDTVQEIIRHHRIQASTGVRGVADAGVATEILRFPANFATQYWTSGQFQEWECCAATLELVAPAAQARTLADYSEHKLALVQRSNGTPSAGSRRKSCCWRTARGRRNTPTATCAARSSSPVATRRASTRWRSSGTAPSARSPSAAQTKGFGFVLTPRDGDRLRGQLRAATGPLRVHARIDARLYDGEMEVVSAFIPGTGDSDE